MEHNIRLVKVFDANEILKIYAPYVSGTAVSFETEVPAVEDFAGRIEDTCKKYPWLVYQIDGAIVGYAYASQHRSRNAYRYDVDVSVYVSPEYHDTRIAYRLYDCLFKLLHKMGYINAYAAITTPNEKSMHFHEKFEFTLIGTHHKTGYKFGKWHDVAWFEKTIQTHDDNPKEVLLPTDIPSEFYEKLFAFYSAI